MSSSLLGFHARPLTPFRTGGPSGSYPDPWPSLAPAEGHCLAALCPGLCPGLPACWCACGLNLTCGAARSAVSLVAGRSVLGLRSALPLKMPPARSIMGFDRRSTPVGQALCHRTFLSTCLPTSGGREGSRPSVIGMLLRTLPVSLISWLRK